MVADIAGFGHASGLAFVRNLIENMEVASVGGAILPGRPLEPEKKVRFCFCKKCETLEAVRHQ